ncbi:MAG: hypothetical protein ACI4CS_08050 [Candidatus Weimeria sp.]
MIVERTRHEGNARKGGNPMTILKMIGKMIALLLIPVLFLLWLLVNIIMHLSGIILIPCLLLFGVAGIYFLFKTSWFNFGMMTALTVAGTIFMFLEGVMIVLLEDARNGLKNFLFS